MCTSLPLPFLLKNKKVIKYFKCRLSLEDSENSSLIKLLSISKSCHCHTFGIFHSTQSHIPTNNFVFEQGGGESRGVQNPVVISNKKDGMRNRNFSPLRNNLMTLE